MIQERPREAEGSLERFGHFLNAEDFGRVVPGVEDVQPEFFGLGKRPMRPFSGDEGINAFGGRFEDFAAGSACHHADSAGCRWSAKAEMDFPSHGFLDLPVQVLPIPLRFDLPSDFKERPPRLGETQRIA